MIFSQFNLVIKRNPSRARALVGHQLLEVHQDQKLLKALEDSQQLRSHALPLEKIKEGKVNSTKQANKKRGKVKIIYLTQIRLKPSKPRSKILIKNLMSLVIWLLIRRFLKK